MNNFYFTTLHKREGKLYYDGFGWSKLEENAKVYKTSKDALKTLNRLETEFKIPIAVNSLKRNPVKKVKRERKLKQAVAMALKSARKSKTIDFGTLLPKRKRIVSKKEKLLRRARIRRHARKSETVDFGTLLPKRKRIVKRNPVARGSVTYFIAGMHQGKNWFLTERDTLSDKIRDRKSFTNLLKAREVAQKYADMFPEMKFGIGDIRG